MAGKSPSALSGREFSILKLLWSSGPLTVREVRERLADKDEDKKILEDDLPYTTVLSLLQLMEKKGYVDHSAEGKTYRYRALLERSKTTRLLIRDFVGRFFDGSTDAFVLVLAESKAISPKLWERLKKESANAERKETRDGNTS